MKFHKQTEFKTETTHGNCMQVALACLLDLEINEVPRFHDYFNKPDGSISHEWINIYHTFLNEKGYLYEGHAEKDDFHNIGDGVNGYFTATVQSPRGNFYHSVIVDKHLNFVHDPHPDDTFGEEILGINMIERNLAYGKKTVDAG